MKKRKTYDLPWLAMVSIIVLSSCSPVEDVILPETSLEATEQIQETIEIIDPNPFRTNELKVISAHQGRVLDLAFSNQGEYLASSGQDLAINIWDPTTGQELHSFTMNSVDMADIDISPKEALLASGEAVWDLKNLQEVLILERGSSIPAFVAFSPAGSVLALARMDQETRFWDLNTLQLMDSFPTQEETRTKRMEYSPDGILLAQGVIDGSIRIWDTNQMQIVQTLQYGGETDIHDIGFSPDGRYLASVGRLPLVIQWDLIRSEVVQTFRTRDNMLGVAFSPDGKMLAASGGAEKAILLWDLETGDSLGSLPLSDQSMALAFSPNGGWLAAGTFDGQIYLWDISLQP